jgi:hypothetical protein
MDKTKDTTSAGLNSTKASRESNKGVEQTARSSRIPFASVRDHGDALRMRVAGNAGVG